MVVQPNQLDGPISFQSDSCFLEITSGVDQLRSDCPGARHRSERVQQRIQPSSGDLSIVIEEHQVFASGKRRPFVAGMKKPEILLVLKIADVWNRTYQLLGLVRGAVIDHYDFKGTAGKILLY